MFLLRLYRVSQDCFDISILGVSRMCFGWRGRLFLAGFEIFGNFAGDVGLSELFPLLIRLLFCF